MAFYENTRTDEIVHPSLRRFRMCQTCKENPLPCETDNVEDADCPNLLSAMRNLRVHNQETAWLITPRYTGNNLELCSFKPFREIAYDYSEAIKLQKSICAMDDYTADIEELPTYLLKSAALGVPSHYHHLPVASSPRVRVTPTGKITSTGHSPHDLSKGRGKKRSKQDTVAKAYDDVDTYARKHTVFEGGEASITIDTTIRWDESSCLGDKEQGIRPCMYASSCRSNKNLGRCTQGPQYEDARLACKDCYYKGSCTKISGVGCKKRIVISTGDIQTVTKPETEEDILARIRARRGK